jgi:Zn-finger protein
MATILKVNVVNGNGLIITIKNIWYKNKRLIITSVPELQKGIYLKVDLDNTSNSNGYHGVLVIDCAAKVTEELKRGDIGPDTECSYYPCHFRGQNCSLCFCPFYPCEDPELGKLVDSNRGGKVWSCVDCFWIHRSDVVSGFYSKLGKCREQAPDRKELLQIKKELEKVHFKDAKRFMVMGATS